ncbi:MAG: DUF6158 family protein [Sporichthyaceae bacterium]
MSSDQTSSKGIPARELSDAELAQQGTQAHASRNWVFLHGTSEQFRRHTERMLELEQEYIRRFPKRTWQGSGGTGGGVDLAEEDTLAQVRHLTRTYAAAVEQLLANHSPVRTSAGAVETVTSAPDDVELQLLRRYVSAPEGRLHKLEAHQAAREVGIAPAVVAGLFKAQPPLLVTAGEFRQITEAGRARVESS